VSSVLFRTRRRVLTLAGVSLLGGCVLPPRRADEALRAAGRYWSGRLALQVPDEPQQSFSASFELRGSAQQGELSLFTPLGSTAALLRWAPGLATLRSDGQPERKFPSLDTLVSEATGAAIPVAALFDWLAGVPTAVAGWQADLSQRAQGRLRARRLPPAAPADLRVVLDRP
jgi:outer membrane lipoprotein LolB